MKKIIIVGGAGFIGTHLTKILKDTFTIKILDKRVSKTFPEFCTTMNINNQVDCDKYITDADVVINLAAEHADNVDPIDLYYTVNVDGTQNILTAMTKNNINAIVFTSSVALYGLNKDNPTESHPLDPFNHYGESKWKGEQKIQSWFNQNPENRSVFIIRPTVVFGEGNRGNVYNLIKQMTSGKFVMIGKGENKKSMTYVGNLAEYIKHNLIYNFSGYTVSNYVDKPDLNTKELINYIHKSLGKTGKTLHIPYFIGLIAGYGFDVLAKITGKKLPISKVRIEKFCATTQFSSDVIDRTGFKPKYTLYQAIDNTIASIQNNETVYDEDNPFE